MITKKVKAAITTIDRRIVEIVKSISQGNGDDRDFILLKTKLGNFLLRITQEKGQASFEMLFGSKDGNETVIFLSDVFTNEIEIKSEFSKFSEFLNSPGFQAMLAVFL